MKKIDVRYCLVDFQCSGHGYMITFEKNNYYKLKNMEQKNNEITFVPNGLEIPCMIVVPVEYFSVVFADEKHLRKLKLEKLEKER